METLKRRYIAHCLIGLLASLAVIVLMTVTWMSPTNQYWHKGCFGFLGMGWHPEEWGDKRCPYSYIEGENSEVSHPNTNLSDAAPDLADLVRYNMPQDYPESLQQAILKVLYYPNARAHHSELITRHFRSEWITNLSPITVQTSPVYTVTTFTTEDSPQQVRTYYRSALEKSGWQFLYAVTSNKNTDWLFANNPCADPGIEDADTNINQGCQDLFLGSYKASDEQGDTNPYFLYLTTTLASKMQTIVKLQVGPGNGS